VKGRTAKLIEHAELSDNVVFTTGEFFADGSVIDVIRAESGQTTLLHWDGKASRIAPQVELATRLYRPAALDSSIARVMRLPLEKAPYGNTKELLEGISKAFATYVQLPSNLIALVTAFSVASWFAPNREAVPWLSITGRDSTAARQLMRVLACFCRRALPLTDVTMSGVCSLPLEWGFTLQISQNPPSSDLHRLLNAARERRSCVVHHGRLVHPYAPIVTCTRSPIVTNGSSLTAIEIPIVPSASPLPFLDADAEERIAKEYQPKLLAYMLDNHKNSGNYDADLSALDASLRETARMLITSMPGDAEFCVEAISALKTQHAAMRCNRWTDIDVVLIEALLFFLHEGIKEAVYVGEVGSAAESIFTGRGERLQLAPKNVAARLRDLGLKTEDRDKRGYRFLLTQAFSRQVHELALALDVPSIQDGQHRCEQCVPHAGSEPHVGVGVLNVPNVRNEHGDVGG